MLSEVSMTPPSRATIRSPTVRTTPNPVLAIPGSMPMTITASAFSPRPRMSFLRTAPGGAAPASGRRRGLLEDLFRHVEVRVHRVDVVVLLERVHQPEQGRGVVLSDLDGGLRLHRELGGLNLDAGVLESRANGRQIRCRGGDLEEVAVLGHVLGSGIDRRHQVVLAVAIAVDEDHSSVLELPGD